MFIRFSFFLVAAFLCLANVACSTDTVGSREVRPDTIYQEYRLSFDEKTGNSTVEAWFRVGGLSGTTVRLDSPANLRVNGKEVPVKPDFRGTHYELELPGYVSVATFEYTTSENKVLVNSIGIDRLTLHRKGQFGNLSANQPFEIALDAPNLTAHETIEVLIKQEIRSQEGDQKGMLEHFNARGTYDSARGKVVVPVTELQKLKGGYAHLEISRTKLRNLAQSTREGGAISAAYSLQSIPMTMTSN